jgi:hypothetical protein
MGMTPDKLREKFIKMQDACASGLADICGMSWMQAKRITEEEEPMTTTEVKLVEADETAATFARGVTIDSCGEPDGERAREIIVRRYSVTVFAADNTWIELRVDTDEENLSTFLRRLVRAAERVERGN